MQVRRDMHELRLAASNRSNVESALALAEASQARERATTEKLRAVRASTVHERVELERRTESKQLQLKRKETALKSRTKQSVSVLEGENARLRTQLQRSKTHCGHLREHVAVVLQKQSGATDAWHARLADIERGVSALIKSTTEAMEADGSEKLSNGTTCKGKRANQACAQCAAKSEVVEDLRETTSSATAKLTEALRARAKIASSAAASLAALQTVVSAQAHEFRGAMQESSEAHITAEAVSAASLGQLSRGKQCAEAQLRDARVASERVSAEAEATCRKQLEAQSETCRMLRGMLDAERGAFERLRAKMLSDRGAWEAEVDGLRQRLSDEAALRRLDAKTFAHDQEFLAARASVVKHDLALARDEGCSAREQVAAFEEKEASGSDLLSVLRRRHEAAFRVLEMEDARGEAKVAEGESEVALRVEAEVAMLAELSTLRESEAAHQAEVGQLRQDKIWLRKERDAVAQGLELRQSCVQDQLKVVRMLTSNMDNANQEKTSVIESSIKALSDIKDSLQVQGSQNEQD